MRLAIHIGYHKTATTWMQRCVFVPEMGFAPLLDHAETDRLIIRPHDLDFDPEPARSTLASRMEALSNDTCPVISSENLSGHPFFGGRQSAELAHRLKDIAPDARIIVTVRSQTTMLASVYMQYLQRGGTLDHKAFFEGTDGFGYPGFEPEHFQYDRLIALYQSLFETVHVMTYEQLTTAPDLALSALGSALHHPMPDLPRTQTGKVSASLPQTAAPWLRRINLTRRSTLNPAPAITLSREPGWMYRAMSAAMRSPLAKPFRNARPIDDYVRYRFAGEFADSNARLNQLTKGQLDLTTYPQSASSPSFQGSAFTTAAGPVSDL